PRGATQFHAFRMSPQERRRGAGLSAKEKMTRRQVRCVPDLLGYETNASGKFLEGTEIRLRIKAGGKLIMTSLSRQQRPRTPDPPSLKRVPVLALPITIMVVAAPTGTEGCIDLEHSVHDAKGVTDERVVRATNSITNQFEKTGIHDCVGRKFNAITGPLIYQDQDRKSTRLNSSHEW